MVVMARRVLCFLPLYLLYDAAAV